MSETTNEPSRDASSASSSTELCDDSGSNPTGDRKNTPKHDELRLDLGLYQSPEGIGMKCFSTLTTAFTAGLSVWDQVRQLLVRKPFKVEPDQPLR